MPSPSAPPVRLSELVASLSLATDLGLGLPQEHVLRQTVIAARVADAAGLPPGVRAATFFVSLLAWVGCIADSHELARWFDDDRQIRADSYQWIGPGCRCCGSCWTTSRRVSHRCSG